MVSNKCRYLNTFLLCNSLFHRLDNTRLETRGGSGPLSGWDARPVGTGRPRVGPQFSKQEIMFTMVLRRRERF